MVHKLNQSEIKQMIFYNFFELDRTNRGAEGDLKLKKNKDNGALEKYQQMVQEKRSAERVKKLVWKLIHELEDLRDSEIQGNLEKMVDDANKLIDLASEVILKGDLEKLLDDQTLSLLGIGMDDLSRINFLSRYGINGDQVRELVIMKKWERIKRQRSMRKRRKKSKNSKKKSKKGRPRYVRESKRVSRIQNSKKRKGKKLDTSVISDKCKHDSFSKIFFFEERKKLIFSIFRFF